MSHPRRTTRALAIALALATLALGAACGGKSDDASTAQKTTDSGKAAVDKAASPAAGKGVASTNAGGSTEFASLFAKYKAAESRVDYEFAMSGAGAMSGTMTMRQAPGKTRIDFVSSQGTFTIITLAEKSYMCIAEQQICLDAGAGSGATAMGAASNPLLTAVQDFNTNAAGYTNRELDRRRIAGLEARCFENTSPRNEKSVTCVGPEGQLLLAEFSGGGQTTTMTATKVEGKPAATDFDPPYPVTSLAGLGGFGMPGAVPGGIPTPAR